MSNRNEYLVQGVRKFSPLLQAYEQGLTYEEIKRSIEIQLMEEFKNKNNINRYGIDLLANEAVNIAKIKNSDSAYELYKKCLEIRRDFLCTNQDLCAQICAQWEESIGKALSLYWNSARFEHNKKDLSLDEFAYESFRNIGGLLEGTLQTYLKELLHLTLANEGLPTSFEKIVSMDFGVATKELEIRLGLDVLRPQPWNLPLNQWRNIAQHYAVDICGETIKCQYGKKLQHTLLLTRDELWDALAALFCCFSAVRTAHTIFFLDHADSLVKYCKGTKRKDQDLQFQFIVGAAAQGFEVTEIIATKEYALAKMIDVTTQVPKARAIHASQFVYQLWIATSADEVEVVYTSKCGQYKLKAKAKSADCENIYSGLQDFNFLATVMEFESF